MWLWQWTFCFNSAASSARGIFCGFCVDDCGGCCWGLSFFSSLAALRMLIIHLKEAFRKECDVDSIIPFHHFSSRCGQVQKSFNRRFKHKRNYQNNSVLKYKYLSNLVPSEVSSTFTSVKGKNPYWINSRLNELSIRSVFERGIRITLSKASPISSCLFLYTTWQYFHFIFGSCTYSHPRFYLQN